MSSRVPTDFNPDSTYINYPVIPHWPTKSPGKSSHSARSAWIETGDRTLNRIKRLSHSARSAWIETRHGGCRGSQHKGRTPQGVRGLKPVIPRTMAPRARRTPQGVRGLKHIAMAESKYKQLSHSARSAWIETTNPCPRPDRGRCRTPQGVRGLKLFRSREFSRRLLSHSARSAWIETSL